MAPAPLVKKLRIQPDQRLLVLNPPSGYLESLGPLPDGARWVDESATDVDFCHVFATNRAQLVELLPAALAACKPDGLFWVSYPKKSSKVASDLSRDVLWELPGETGLRPVTQISIDQVWSALRYRPGDLVGKR